MKMTHTEIVNKLIGEIQPTGMAHRDPARFENLKEMCTLVDNLVLEIHHVSQTKDAQEHSIREMGKYADNFLMNY